MTPTDANTTMTDKSRQTARDPSQEQICRFCSEALDEFKQVTRQYALFHIGFFAIGVIELSAFILFFSFLTKTAIFAFSLAGLFFTLFTYFVLLFYFQAKKPQQLVALRNSFLQNCKTVLLFAEGTSDYHLKLSSALTQMLTLLHRQEYSYYSLPTSFETLCPLIQKFSVWTHWKDLYQMKELLLLMIIKEKIEVIKLQPTDLEAHAHLADAYLALSRLHTDPRKLYLNEEHLFVSHEYASIEMQRKFQMAAQRAIEEYKILDAYAPNDPWVQAQLASIYRALNRPEEEMQAYETIVKMTSSDGNILLRLGTLYFEQGFSAKALQLYEILKANGDPAAEELISQYGIAISEQYPEYTLN